MEPRDQERLNAWLRELSEFGGRDSLKHFESSPFGQIDLERAHPGGLAQFVTGGHAMLSNLVRDPLAHSRATAAARRLRQRANRLNQEHGIRALWLAAGILRYSAEGENRAVPILLWPLSISSKNDDFELALTGDAVLNPVLLDLLDLEFGVKPDANYLAGLMAGSVDLIPISVLNYIAQLTSERTSPEVKRILVAGIFVPSMLELRSRRSLEMGSAVRYLVESDEPGSLLQSDGDGLPDPLLVADADITQQRIVARSVAGQSFAVETLPGCGYTQTVINLVAANIWEGKRVLLVAPRRQTLNELADRLSDIGLNGLAIRSESTWLDAIAAISRNEKAKGADSAELRARLAVLAAKFHEYFDALRVRDAELGVSIVDALEALAALSASERPPVNEARIPVEKLGQFEDLDYPLTLLMEAHDLGQFEYGEADTAWFNGQFESPSEMDHAIALARKLHDESFPRLAKQLADFTTQAGFRAADSVADWGRYLQLFVGVRESLDRFVPDVFDRSIHDLIAATAPRRESSDMSGGNRRRLKKLAKEYLRPGMTVTDLHASLIQIQQQREQWQKFSEKPRPPEVPAGIGEAQVVYQAFLADLHQLQRHLPTAGGNPDLTELDLSDLDALLGSLATKTDYLSSYGDRAPVLQSLIGSGLHDLVRELARLHSLKSMLKPELELAWWQSTLEELLRRRPLLADYDAVSLEKLEREYAQKDLELTLIGRDQLRDRLAERWRKALESYATEATALRELLRAKQASLKTLASAAPRIWQVLAPAVLASPFELHEELPPGERFDLVVALDAAGASVAEHLSGLERAPQLVVFGDPTIATPRAVTFEPTEGYQLADEPNPRPSLFTEAAVALGSEVLAKSYRAGGQVLAEFINEHFYGNRIGFEPGSHDYFGDGKFRVELVADGNRANTAEADATESLDAELEHVVELIFNHALWHPEQSLLVVSASERHAERIRAAVLAQLPKRPQLFEYFERHGREKFESTTLLDLGHRISDRIIFSVGFGHTAHGAVLSKLGQLSLSSARRNLANLLVSARHQFTLVSCLKAEELDAAKSGDGAGLLGQILGYREVPLQDRLGDFGSGQLALLTDLARRLGKAGATTGSLGERGYLAASYASKAALIELDSTTDSAGLRESLRLRPKLLTDLGWHYLRVNSLSLFSDPQLVANRVIDALGAKKPRSALKERNEPAFEDTPLAWGDGDDSNDRRLRDERPPHAI